MFLRWSRSASLIFLCLLTCHAWANATYSVKPTPSWVYPVTAKESETTIDRSGQSVHYILVNSQTKAFENNQYVRFRNYVEKPLSYDGLDQSGTIEIFFKPDFQDVTLHHVRLTRNGTRLDKLNDARISVVNVEPESDINLYSAQAKVLIIIPDFKLGDTLDYAFSIAGRNPVVGNNLYSRFPLGWGVPVDQTYSSLEVPSHKTLQHRTHLTDVEPERIQTEKTIRWELNQFDVPIYDEDTEIPSYERPYPHIEFSEFQDWREVREWADPLFQIKGAISHPQWTDWLNEIKTQPTDERKITHGLQLVQNNIRYIGIEIGENSHKPRQPDTTLNNAYGDCKDVSLLLVSLLNAAGVEAEPVLVHTQLKRSLSEQLPTPFAFNHVIARAKLDGRFVYVDPTLGYQAGHTVAALGYYDYEVGLPVYNGSKLETLPKKAVDEPLIHVREEFQAYDFALPVRLDVSLKYLQEEADYQRSRLSNRPHSDIQKSFIDYYRRMYGQTTSIGPLTYVDNEETNEVAIFMSFWIKDFYEFDNEDDVYRYEVRAFAIDDYMELPDQIDRALPFDLGSLTEIQHDIVVNHPAIYRTDDYPVISENFEDPHFNFKVWSLELESGSHYQFHYKNFSTEVAAKHMPEFSNLVDEARQHLYYNGWFSAHVPPSTNPPGRQFLKDLIGSKGAPL